MGLFFMAKSCILFFFVSGSNLCNFILKKYFFQGSQSIEFKIHEHNGKTLKSGIFTIQFIRLKDNYTESLENLNGSFRRNLSIGKYKITVRSVDKKYLTCKDSFTIDSNIYAIELGLLTEESKRNYNTKDACFISIARKPSAILVLEPTESKLINKKTKQ